VVEAVGVGVDDARVLAEITAADKAGIDCPLGWPEPFIEFLTGQRAGTWTAPADVAGRDWRRRLAVRTTDLVVREQTRLIPLSVAADRIAHPAMRCAGLLAALAAAGQPVNRCGDGVVVEVYPSASLRIWDLDHRGYKGTSGTARRRELLTALTTAAPWLRLDPYGDDLHRSDHALDAVIAALTARAAALGHASRPDQQQAGLAASEGWIALPSAGLDLLVR